MNYTIRQIRESEYPILKDFLYEAIYVPQGAKPPSRAVLDSFDLQIYIGRFGEQKDDHGLVADADGKIAGAVWVRIMNDYGHIDSETPSLAISVRKEYRGLGIGSALLESMLALLKKSGYHRVSLSVQKANYAARMYLKAGFQIVRENAEEYIMVCYLS